ncbi:MAG: DoxX family membrane protein [Cytophagaceae bacterium]|nr:DoxX family membrane protein [Cytophagaceae bacterium]
MKFQRFLLVSTRLFLGLVFFTSGMGKLTHGNFPGIIGPVWLEERLAEYGLALFARFVAYSQVLVGLLLLSQRFATLGAVMLFPMLMSIFMVTVSLQWRGTPYVNAFLLVLNAGLLIADFHKLKFLLNDDITELKPLNVRRRTPRVDALWVLAMILLLGSSLVFGYSRKAFWVIVAIGLLLLIGCQVLAYRQQRVIS